mmetsp:Transcript_123315/g.343421  ORF Transcript_123315/g.343421 Transcript_123315/m.343421 type:complete len:204 (+) Transcript_123315:182-793(+)
MPAKEAPNCMLTGLVHQNWQERHAGKARAGRAPLCQQGPHRLDGPALHRVGRLVDYCVYYDERDQEGGQPLEGRLLGHDRLDLAPWLPLALGFDSGLRYGASDVSDAHAVGGVDEPPRHGWPESLAEVAGERQVPQHSGLQADGLNSLCVGEPPQGPLALGCIGCLLGPTLCVRYHACGLPHCCHQAAVGKSRAPAGLEKTAP